MTHRNAPLTVLGRQRAVAQVNEAGRPIAHVAAEFRIARSTLSKWGRSLPRLWPGRARRPLQRSSFEAHAPATGGGGADRALATEEEVVGPPDRPRARRSPQNPMLRADGDTMAGPPRTEPDPRHHPGDGEDLRRPGKIIARYPGHMVHMDVKKIGKIPDGGGWRIHGRGSEKALASKRSHKQKVGYTYLHSMEDGFSRLAYTESLEDETAATTIGFFHRARVFFAEHGITWITRLVTDNGSTYTTKAFHRSTCAFISRHQRTRAYTPRHNGKIERYQRILTDECLYARAYDSEDERRDAIGVWNHHYNYHRPHTACGDQPPASRLHTGVDNVMTNYN